MIEVISFSRDRACQLDLLLRSLEENAPGCFDPIHVVWLATDDEYERGYFTCKEDHPEAAFQRQPPGEYGLQRATRKLLKKTGPAEGATRGGKEVWTRPGESPVRSADSVGGASNLLMFAMDDDVLYRPFDVEPTPEKLMKNQLVLAVSLRLGKHTGVCYPHQREQELPLFSEAAPDALFWTWRDGDGDFGYPFSLDGHIFRRHLIQELQRNSEYRSPNQLEDVLASRAHQVYAPMMACYRESCLVGIPANKVSDTHLTNRYGTRQSLSTRALNSRYILGDRLSLGELMRTETGKVTGAHTELGLAFS